jgi:hypothetical protein
MSEFLTTSGVAYRLEDIVRSTQTQLVLVSPYLQLSQTFYERLLDVSATDASTTLVYRTDKLTQEAKRQLADVKGLILYQNASLHAKCYYNEDAGIITSMNLYEYSEKNNREMGVYIARRRDRQLYQQMVQEAESIIQASQRMEFVDTESLPYLQPYTEAVSNPVDPPRINHRSAPGYCIRCSTEISFNADRPYCWSCYRVWSDYGNFGYEEDNCHSCGYDGKRTSMRDPICHRCTHRLEQGRERITRKS